MDSTVMTPALITNPVQIFFIVLVIILLAPILLNRLKIPHIVGMIVAGLIVGPYGLNLLDRDSSFQIFGQVGVLYLMFLAGLEIDMFHLKQNVKRGLGFGLLTFFVPLILGTVSAVVMLKLSVVTALLLASMYASHTLIAYPVVTRIGIVRSPVVLVSIVGTIIAIVGSLLVLAGAVSVTKTGEYSVANILRLLLFTAIYCGAVLYIYPRVTRWFFKHFSDKVTQYVFVMMLVFLSSWTAQGIGLESVLGAFFAGLVLNRYIPSVSPLMSSIEFVGNAIFIPYFLIGVGMLIDIRAFSDTSTLIVALHMVVVALAGKWIAAWITQKAYHFTSADRGVMFGLTTAHTAVALAVMMIGYETIMPDGSRLLNDQILNGTVIMILITCAIAPIVTAGAAAKVKVRMMADADSGKNRRKQHKQTNTLVSVTNPVTAGSLVDLALLMKRTATSDSLFALHVRNDNSANSIAIGKNALKLAAETAAAGNVQLQTIERYDMNTVMGIVNTVKERDITDIVVGMHRKTTVVDTYMGPVIESLLNELNKMIIISRCYIPINTVTRVVVAVPEKAEFETGFEAWVLRVSSIAQRIGCRVIFFAHSATLPLLRGVVHRQRLGLRAQFRQFNDWRDLPMLANRMLDDDLFVVVSARRLSLSFNNDMDELPGLLNKYFTHTNLLLVYPEQFGEAPKLDSFSDPMTWEINTSPAGIWLRARKWLRWMWERRRSRRRQRREKKTYL